MVESRAAGVQSVARALDLLEALAEAGGTLSLTEMSGQTGLPAGTLHRIARTLVTRGYLRQLPDRRYCLGSRLVSIGAAANSLVGSRARPVLREIATAIGETANLAVLSGGLAEYVAQAAGSHSMRMFTEVGRRVPAHSTGVGKALLSMLDDTAAARLMREEGMPRFTETTITGVDALLDELALIRDRGYAIDEGEMELGVRCVAIPVTAGTLMAVSVSGPAGRMTDDLVARSVTALERARTQLISAFDDVG